MYMVTRNRDEGGSMYNNDECNKNERVRLISVTLLLLMISSMPLSAAVLFEHTGSADPTTEGWSIGGSGTPGSNGVYTGPIINDVGSGLDAWYVNDTASFGGSNQSYYGSLTSGQVTQASTNGWTLSTTIRIPNASETAAYSPFILYRDGEISWDVAFGSTSGGDPIVKLITSGYPRILMVLAIRFREWAAPIIPMIWSMTL